ncbi:SWIM zinc finger family protein [Dietzia sp.]|uniref:SWIM zinc finger family protein n=1 Tax=Dietzia sp. TaxID=1871616 RepID=UPI002FDB5364
MSGVFRGQEGPGVPVATKVGDFGAHHWSRRWIAAVEERAGRSAKTNGRAAARARWVLDVQIGWRRVLAHVQGSQPDPFEVVLSFDPPNPVDVPRIEAEVQRVGLPAALSGNVSEELAARLVPPLEEGSALSCTCPDQPGPCMHIVAAVAVLVERLDKNPQDLFRLRGYPPRATESAAGGRRRGAGRIGSSDVMGFWLADPALPAPPTPQGTVSDLLDGASARALADAVAGGNTLATLAILADLEDLYVALGEGGLDGEGGAGNGFEAREGRAY